MLIDAFPIGREPLRHVPEQVRGQVRHLHPRQDQKARIGGEEAQVRRRASALQPMKRSRSPSAPRGRSPREARHRAVAGDDEILQVLADRLLVAEIVMLREQAVEEAFVRRAADLMEAERAQRPERRLDGTRVDQDRRRACARSPGLPGGPLRGREVNMAGAMQPQEQAAADRIAGRPIRLPPLPGLAQREGQRAPAEARRRGEPRPNRGEIVRRDHAATIRERRLHVPRA